MRDNILVFEKDDEVFKGKGVWCNALKWLRKKFYVCAYVVGYVCI